MQNGDRYVGKVLSMSAETVVLQNEVLRKLKSELGPEAGDSLDAYLEILDGFLKESGAGTSTAPTVTRPK